MADITSIPTHSGIQAGYQYTPVETRLNPPIHLDPVNYDAIQKAVSGILPSILQSPINPAVRNQIQEEAARYDLGKRIIAGLKPEDVARRVGVGPQGPEIIPGYQVGNIPPPPPGSTTDNNPPPPPPQQQVTNNPDQTGSNITQTPAKQVAPVTNTYDQNPPAVTAGSPGNYGNAFAPPKSTVPGPADNVPQQPPQQKILQNQTQGQNPAANLAYMPSGQGAQSPGAANLADQQALTQWQNANAHPVMSSQDALAWAKHFDTGISRATYLPAGGPGGQPAYNFTSKGPGGQSSNNIVPITQILQNGGRGLIAAQNTSQVLSGASQQQPQPGQPPGQGQQPQVAQQGPQQPQGQPQQPGQQGPPIVQPQGAPQLAQNVPGAPGTQVTANTPLTPEEKAYIASQGDMSVFAADTNNHNLLAANAQANAARGDTQLAANTIRDNPSNVARSTDPLQNDPPPVETANQYAKPALAQAMARPGGLNSLEDAGSDYPGIKKLGARTPNGIQWFVDTDPNDSHQPFLMTQTSPWSVKRLYNTVANEWLPVEVVRPDRILDQTIKDKFGLDSTSWKNADGSPNTALKVKTIRDDYNTRNSNPMSPEVQAKLESLRSQVVQSQIIKEGIRDGHMTDGDWSVFKQIQNNIRDGANMAGGAGFADEWMRKAAQFFAPGGYDWKLRTLSDAYGNLMKGREDPNLSAEERGELGHITMGTTLPGAIDKLNLSRMIEFNRYYNQAVANRMRISDNFMGDADEISANHRLRNTGTPNLSTLSNGQLNAPASNSPAVLAPRQVPAAPTPAPTPQPTPVPNNSQQNAIKLSGSRQDQINAARKYPSKTWVQSGNNVFQTP